MSVETNSPGTTPDPPRTWTPGDVAQYLQVSERYVRNLVHDPSFPQGRKVGRLRRWNPDDVVAWVSGSASPPKAVKPAQSPAPGPALDAPVSLASRTRRPGRKPKNG